MKHTHLCACLTGGAQDREPQTQNVDISHPGDETQQSTVFIQFLPTAALISIFDQNIFVGVVLLHFGRKINTFSLLLYICPHLYIILH